MTARLASDLAQGLRKAKPEDSFSFAASIKEFFELNVESFMDTAKNQPQKKDNAS